MIYFCCDEKRRSLVRGRSDLNGIDFLEVGDHQKTLCVYFLKPLSEIDPPLSVSNFRITGGERIRDIRVVDVGCNKKVLRLRVDQPGDYSTYTLHLIDPDTGSPPAWLDPRLASIDFSFKVECEREFDCVPVNICAPEVRIEPNIDYLAKDFASFRQVMLDRLSLLVPNWRERNTADLGIALIELMVYVGDYLSYRQDAVATEAYLGTARQRVSIKRHARLLDYPMHEGCNARVWIQVWLKEPGSTARRDITKGLKLYRTLRARASKFLPLEKDEIPIPSEDLNLRVTRFTTTVNETTVLSAEPNEFKKAIDLKSAEVFEPLEDVELFPDHNEFQFYTWGDERCCLPRGATKATLFGHHPDLQANMVLVLAEVAGPLTGNPKDADLRRRHPVRLTVVNTFDSKDNITPLKDPLTGNEVTEIEWADEDALPFALCVSSIATEGPLSGKLVSNVSVAWGNVVLADHGMTILQPERLDPAPKANPALATVGAGACGSCADPQEYLLPARYRSHLKSVGLTFAVSFQKYLDPITKKCTSAASAFYLDARRAMPSITLGAKRQRWEPRRDLLNCEGFDRNFVIEMENDGRAAIRFGNDVNGMRPAEDTVFYALYRIGNGTRGNVGAESITQISISCLFDGYGSPISTDAVVERVTNPLPASGGSEPETMEEVRQYAPQAFRVSKRCVTPADYANRAEQHPEVQRAAATIQWTGSWHTIFLAVDRRGGREVDAAFKRGLREWLEPYRLAGHDLEIDTPQFVSVVLQLYVCVARGYFRSDVKRALLDAFSSRERSDGSRGFFHPDNWTFGQPIFLSQILATAQKVAGVQQVQVKKLQRQGSHNRVLPDVLRFGRLEILRLENDPNFPDHGQIDITMAGGR